MQLSYETASVLERGLGLEKSASPEERLIDSIKNPQTKIAVRLALMQDPSGDVARRLIAEYRKGLAEGLKDAEAEEKHLKRAVHAIHSIIQCASKPFSIGPARASNMSRAISGAWARKERAGALAVVKSSAPQAFLIQHDWASIFDGTDLAGSEFVLPADQCCFEFSVNGMELCAFVFSEDGEPRHFVPVWKTPVGWYASESYAYSGGVWTDPAGADYDDAFFTGIDRIIRSACIALDADVIEKELVTADRAENERRERRGAHPINDHVILRIRRNHSGRGGGTATGARKRLHFRRGHWRRYPTAKTWIRWCMVGDPSLGFRDKDYAL